MEFLQVGDFVTRTAELVLPPLFGIATALLIFRLLNPLAFGRLAAAGRRAFGHHHRLRSAREGLEPYGLGWLVPCAILVALIAAVLCAHGLLALASESSPPHLNRDDIHLIPPAIDRDDRLLLIRKFPGADSYEGAYDLAVKAWDLEGKKSFGDTVGYLERIMRMAKYLAGVALLAWLLGLGRPGARGRTLVRLIAVLAACTVLWAAGALLYLRGMESIYQHRWREIRNTLRVEAYSRPTERPTPGELRKMSDPAPAPWWNVSWVDE